MDTETGTPRRHFADIRARIRHLAAGQVALTPTPIEEAKGSASGSAAAHLRQARRI